MIIILSNGKKVILTDVVEDPKAKAIKWLQRYKESPGCDPGPETQSEGKELLMSKIVSQIEPQVKRCSDEYCNEDVFRDGPLCLEHFVEVETQAWDDHADEVAQAHAVSVGRG